MAKILEINEQQKDIYNEFIINNKGCFLQSYEWGKFKSFFGFWDVKRFLVEENEKIEAGFSVFIRKIPYINKTFLYMPRGPVVREQNKGLNRDIFESIKEQGKISRSIFLKVEPETEKIPDGWPGFFENKKHIQPRCTMVLDLTKGEDALLSGFESKTRYNIRVGQKKGIEIIRAGERSDIKKFFDILEETSRRQKFLIHRNEYYETLWDIFYPEKMLNLFLACYKGKPVAGLFLITFGDKCWYLYGASGNIHRETMPNYALHWEAIKWAKINGFKEYDLWGIPYIGGNKTAPDENHPLFGVWRFKKGFGGEVVKYAGTFDIPYSAAYYKLFEKGIKIYFNLRNLSTRGESKDALQD